MHALRLSRTTTTCIARLASSAQSTTNTTTRLPRGSILLACRPRQAASGSRMSSSTSSSTSVAVSFSSGTDEPAMSHKLRTLLASAGQGGQWLLVPSGQGLERSFKFKTFAKTWDFMTAVSLQCKIKNHHPEWSNVYNTTYIRWTTHEPKGLSEKDVELAAICDALAKDFGEQPLPASSHPTTAAGAASEQDPVSCQIRGLADRVASGAGVDCCVPSKSGKQQ